MTIDTSFDFRTDANGKDPDNWSPMLKAYQRILYSKPLPNGEVMQLDEKLAWNGFQFSSDSILHSFASWECYRHIISQIDESVLAEYQANNYFNWRRDYLSELSGFGRDDNQSGPRMQPQNPGSDRSHA